MVSGVCYYLRWPFPIVVKVSWDVESVFNRSGGRFNEESRERLVIRRRLRIVAPRNDCSLCFDSLMQGVSGRFWTNLRAESFPISKDLSLTRTYDLGKRHFERLFDREHMLVEHSVKGFTDSPR